MFPKAKRNGQNVSNCAYVRQACMRFHTCERRRTKKNPPQKPAQEVTRSHITTGANMTVHRESEILADTLGRRVRGPNIYSVPKLSVRYHFSCVHQHIRRTNSPHSPTGTHTHTHTCTQRTVFFPTNSRFLSVSGLNIFVFRFIHNTLSYIFKVVVRCARLDLTVVVVVCVASFSFAVRASVTIPLSHSHRAVFVPFICIPIPN